MEIASTRMRRPSIMSLNSDWETNLTRGVDQLRLFSSLDDSCAPGLQSLEVAASLPSCLAVFICGSSQIKYSAATLHLPSRPALPSFSTISCLLSPQLVADDQNANGDINNETREDLLHLNEKRFQRRKRSQKL